jgi:hypothetical protein
MLNEGHGALHQTTQIVIHGLEMQALQIGNISGDMERKYLARATLQYFVAAQPTVEHKATLARPIPLANDVVIGAHLSDTDRKIENGCLFLSGKAGDAFEFSQKRIEDVRHARILPGGGARSSLSATGT